MRTVDSAALSTDAGASYAAHLGEQLEATIFTFVDLMGSGGTQDAARSLDAPRRFEEARAAIVLLNTLARARVVRLSEHCNAARWRDEMLRYFDQATGGEAVVRAMLRQALERDGDELVLHARGGDDRPGEPHSPLECGAVERLLRASGAPDLIAQWAHAFGDDLERALRDCPRGDWMLALARAAGASNKELLDATCACIAGDALVKAPASRSDGPGADEAIAACLARAPSDPAARQHFDAALGSVRGVAQRVAAGRDDDTAWRKLAFALAESAQAAMLEVVSARPLPLTRASIEEANARKAERLATFATRIRERIRAPQPPG